MSTPFIYCDNIFIQLSAICLNRDIVVVPIHSESATLNGQFSIYKSAGDNGALNSSNPLYVMYFESWRFRSAHYQSLKPSASGRNVALDYISANRLSFTFDGSGSACSWLVDSGK